MSIREEDGLIILDNGITMCFDMNAAAEYKILTNGGNIFEAIDVIAKENCPITIRNVIYSCLVSYNDDIDIKVAGRVSTKYPNALAEAIQASMPKAEATSEEAPTKTNKKK